MTKEEKGKILDFLGSYIPIRSRIAQTQKDIDMFEKRLNFEGASEYEKELMAASIQHKKERIDEDRKTLLLFETAMSDLDGLDLLVFRQLYVEGKQQNEVTDSDGRIMPRTSVKRRRDHAIEIVGDFILKFLMNAQKVMSHR